MHVGEGAGYLDEYARAIMPLKYWHRGVEETGIQCTNIHKLQYQAPLGAIKGHGEQLVDVRVLNF